MRYTNSSLVQNIGQSTTAFSENNFNNWPEKIRASAIAGCMFCCAAMLWWEASTENYGMSA